MSHIFKSSNQKTIWEPHPGSQVDFLECPAHEVLLHGNRGGGKQLPDNTGILTPIGWVPIGSLRVGDIVYDRFGKECRVTGVFPQGIQQVYEMHLLDGRKARCGLEHNWLVRDRGGFLVKTTKDLLSSKLFYHNAKSGNTYKYKIPLASAVDFKEKVLPIDPYILGCLLGNGTLTTRTPKIATSSDTVLSEFRNRLPDFEIVYDKSTNNNYTIVDRNKLGVTFPGVPRGTIQPEHHNRLTDAIDYLGIGVKCKHKFIPTIYKWGSYNQRFELLQGLMDTDGRNTGEFTNTSKELIDDVAYLCRSLGIKCRISIDDRVGKPKIIHGITYSFENSSICYRLYINTLLPIAKTPYKIRDIGLLKDTPEKKFTPITHITVLDEYVSQTCISVDSPDHTYIIEDFIVTHNTDVLLMDYLQDVGVGYGRDWRGILFREEFTQLTDVINKSKKWISQIFPGAKYNGSDHKWEFPEGETLYLRYMRVASDYWGYHGHEYSIYANANIRMASGYKRAEDVRVGDYVDTLCGPCVVDKVFKYKKPAVKLSVYDEHCCLIGEQFQGIIHPVLTNDGWQRLGLSCLSQISEQSSFESPLTLEVFRFLAGVHQEILLSLPKSLLFPLETSTGVLHQAQFSVLLQIFEQLPEKSIRIFEAFQFLLGIDLDTLSAVSFLEISAAVFGSTNQQTCKSVQLLALYCVFLVVLLLRVRQGAVRFLLSTVSRVCGLSFSQVIKISQVYPLYPHEIRLGQQQQLLFGKVIAYQSEVNATYLDVLLAIYKALGYLGDRFGDLHQNDEPPHHLGVPCPKVSTLLYGKSPDSLENGQICYQSPYSFGYFPKKQELIYSGPHRFGNTFSVAALDSPIDMVDFEIRYAKHYISVINDNIPGGVNIVNSKSHIDITNNMSSITNNYHIVNQNCWQGWEELTNWSTDECYKMMMSTNRSSNPNVPKKIRATCNPSGIGHGWVKHRFIDVAPPKMIYRDPETKKSRVHIPLMLAENTTLLESDPEYQMTIAMAVQDDPSKRKAWIEGSWDIIDGGFFSDVWDTKIHVLTPFPFPKSWRVIRSFDWGSQKPWCVTYVAECNGDQPDPYYNIPYLPKGSSICIMEIYGWNGTANEGDRALSQDIAERTLAVDKAIELEYGCKVHIGPADTSIWDVRDGTSIAKNMTDHGLWWQKAYKGSGSRVSGLALIRTMLGAAKRRDLEHPHLYFFESARHHIRTIPIQQMDPKKPEDINTDLEDHCFTLDTTVITDKGVVSIGSLVGTTGNILSVNGEYQRYYNCRLIKKNAKIIKVNFSDNFSVKCTPDHKFLTNIGFVSAKDLLTVSGIYCIVSKNQKGDLRWKQLQSFQKLYKDFVEKTITCVGVIFKKVGFGCIELYGSIIMGLSPKGIISTIKMKINTITSIVIWNYYQWVNTYLRTQRLGACAQLNRLWMPPLYGIKGIKDGNGIKRIMRMLKKPCIQSLLENAQSAVKSIQVIGKVLTRSVVGTVSFYLGRSQGLMTLQEPVSYVVPSLEQISTERNAHVVLRATENFLLLPVSIEEIDVTEDVYCLEVENTKTFALGNGVIVSNCIDSIRYLLARKLNRLQRKKVRT